MKVGMWATDVQEYMPLLLYTLKKGKVPYEISEGAKWISGRGWEIRMRWFHEWCSRQGREQVMLLDPFDHVLLGDVDLLQDRIDALIEPTQVLWAAETKCWPSVDRAVSFPKHGTGYDFPNGGAIVGPADFLADLFNPTNILGFGKLNYNPEGVYHPDGNQPWLDQVFFQDLYLGGIGVLDYECRLFQTLVNHRQDDFKRVGRWIENVHTEEWPLLFHANGRSKFPDCLMTLLEEIL